MRRAVTECAIRALVARSQPMVAILWGRDAQTLKPMLAEGGCAVIESAHPSPLSASRGFFGSRPFSRANDELLDLGGEPERVEAQPRQAFFFDTPDLALNKAGVVVRARRIQGGDGDTVIKLRPVDPSTIDPDLRRSAAFKIEVDAMPGGFVCSASFKGACTGQEVLDVASGEMPLRKLFSKEQRAFYDAHAPADITMDKLVLLGPTFLLKSKHQPKAKDFDRPIILEVWIYPDGSIVMEVSTKCLPKEAFQVAGDFKDYLARHGIALGADQSAKTRTALEFFSARLKKEGSAG